MKKLLVFILFVGFVLSLNSCFPPKGEVKYIYDYLPEKVYVYDFELNGDGIITYLLLSYSGNFSLKTSFILSSKQEANQKLFTIVFNKFDLKSSSGFFETINQLINFTNLEISFYMDDKGNKRLKTYDPFSLLLLDLLFPKLPEVDPTNEIIFRTFDFKVGDSGIRNEISNVVNVYGLSKNFYINSFTSFSALELENNDIVVGDIKFKGSGKVIDFVLNEYTVELGSKSTIPLFLGTATKIIGFKGNAVIRLKLKEVM
ncbi:MAG: hypothetical protein ACP5QP_00215 [Brevinematia bacterium]